jgi:DNA-binding CsgD family transcriptional regulator
MGAKHFSELDRAGFATERSGSTGHEYRSTDAELSPAYEWTALPLQHSFRLLDQTGTISLRSLLDAAFEAFDKVSIGLIVSDAVGRGVAANRTADEILERQDGLVMDPSRILQVRSPGSSAKNLVPAMVLRKSRSLNETSWDIVSVKRPSGKTPLTVLIRPCGQLSLEKQNGTILILILDPEAISASCERILQRLYDLTSSEARMAALMMEGKRVDECCAELGIRKSTARTHLQHIFDKLGVQKQSELVAVLRRTVPVIRGSLRPEFGLSSSKKISVSSILHDDSPEVVT